MIKNWNGLVKILEINHQSKDGKILWSNKNLNNVFHKEGESYILTAVFAGEEIPTNFYLGLDGRSDLSAEDNVSDTMASLIDEPTVNGYQRQAVSSTAWTLQLVNGVYRVVSPIMTFQASGGSWGPVKNLFLTNKEDDSGSLIASVVLNNDLTLDDGELVNLRIGLSLRNYDC